VLFRPELAAIRRDRLPVVGRRAARPDGRSQEDLFFATVFLGNGLLFLAMILASLAVVVGLMMASEAILGKLMDSVSTGLLALWPTSWSMSMR